MDYLLDGASQDPDARIRHLDRGRRQGTALRVIERAQTDPQMITRHGKPCVVIVSVDEWARKDRAFISVVSIAELRRGLTCQSIPLSPNAGAI